ncbi:hypothetical protein BAUCODRAFT_62230 [Baudoinia panamericana UAMH 10762]|uniref:Amidohydrolase-related domain-containing protein n=1 Tax=Baudoinia panamericana (strain UAMH 10762) TaxID=717646 RepID=M2NLN1_BAUPA|nr:uncharacterized protein BAUCODRAFT_62230 [Baudoinia panamericana UAMH 10762]EMD00400.1 hypothetical protein BAUCODRAFT_62230 [Baudoinia panamericana UAMH 10762]
MHRIQTAGLGVKNDQHTTLHGLRCDRISNVSLPGTASGSRWDITLSGDTVSTVEPCEDKVQPPDPVTEHNVIDAKGALLAPSLCHPHVHLDKAYLLSHPKYADLQIERGDFAEAMELTSRAKAQFEHLDLLERGQRLIDESVKAGVTHMRAFVEVDAGVGTKCLDAGLELKRKAEEHGRCFVQLCAFAQLPLFTASGGDPDGSVIRCLLEQAAKTDGVDVVGSTPYVEADRDRMEQNVAWMADLAIDQNKHLDFHLDYNLDPKVEPLLWHVTATLRKKHWTSYNENRNIVLGHCTRLTLFSSQEFERLREAIGGLPISFVGLPTSDLYMMREANQRRGTLDIVSMIQRYGMNACLGINNIGNAFTPHGSCDPLALACNGIGIYQSGTKKDVELLYECISTRAREAIGLGRAKQTIENADGDPEEVTDFAFEVKEGDTALLLFGAEEDAWKTRKSVSEAVYLYDHCQGRRVFLNGKLTI